MNFKEHYLTSKAAAAKSLKELDIVVGGLTVTQLYRMDLNERPIHKPTPAQTRDYLFSKIEQ